MAGGALRDIGASERRIGRQFLHLLIRERERGHAFARAALRE